MEECLIKINGWMSCGLEQGLGKMVLFLVSMLVVVLLLYGLMWLIFTYHDFNLMKCKITELERRINNKKKVK